MDPARIKARRDQDHVYSGRSVIGAIQVSGILGAFNNKGFDSRGPGRYSIKPHKETRTITTKEEKKVI